MIFLACFMMGDLLMVSCRSACIWAFQKALSGGGGERVTINGDPLRKFSEQL